MEWITNVRDDYEEITNSLYKENYGSRDLIICIK